MLGHSQESFVPGFREAHVAGCLMKGSDRQLLHLWGSLPQMAQTGVTLLPDHVTHTQAKANGPEQTDPGRWGARGASGELLESSPGALSWFPAQHSIQSSLSSFL